MKHEFMIEDSQEEEVRKLIDAAVVFTGGTAEIVKQLKVVTEDERIAVVLENLLDNNGKKTRNKSAPGTAAKIWTIVATNEQLSQTALQKRLSDKRIEEGTDLFHEERGNFTVDRNDRGQLTLKKDGLGHA